MHKIIATALLFASLTLISKQTLSQEDTSSTNYLYELCSNKGDVGEAYCLGYIGALADWFLTAGNYCPPEGVNAGQTRKIFMKWAENNPEQLHQHQLVSVTLALTEAFPCPEQ